MFGFIQRITAPDLSLSDPESFRTNRLNHPIIPELFRDRERCGITQSICVGQESMPRVVLLMPQYEHEAGAHRPQFFDPHQYQQAAEPRRWYSGLTAKGARICIMGLRSCPLK